MNADPLCRRDDKDEQPVMLNCAGLRVQDDGTVRLGIAFSFEAILLRFIACKPWPVTLALVVGMIAL